jgi:hypothetical protein
MIPETEDMITTIEETNTPSTNKIEWIESPAGKGRQEPIRLFYPSNDEPITMRCIKSGWVDTYHVIIEYGAYGETDYRQMEVKEIASEWGIDLEQ